MQTPFFAFPCFPFPSQHCLLRFSDQIVYTNIEGTRRHKNVPTILTETVAIAFSCVLIYWKCPAKNSAYGISEYLNLTIFWGSVPQTPVQWAVFISTTFLPTCVHLQALYTSTKRVYKDTRMVMCDLWHTWTQLENRCCQDDDWDKATCT